MGSDVYGPQRMNPKGVCNDSAEKQVGTEMHDKFTFTHGPKKNTCRQGMQKKTGRLIQKGSGSGGQKSEGRQEAKQAEQMAETGLVYMLRG